MLNRSLIVALAFCGAVRADVLTIESAVSDAVNADASSAAEMFRLGAFLRSNGRTQAGDAWIDAALAIDPTVGVRSMGNGGDARGAGFGCDTIGPDLTVATISQIALMAHEGDAHDGVTAFGMGIVVCNLGDEEVEWVHNSTRHPVGVQNIYRFQNGRFTQVGMGWAKHEFFALAQNYCCTCTSSSTGNVLGAGCSDVHSAALSASQSLLGPRSEINASTGAFVYPFSTSGSMTSVAKRCQAADADIDPAQNIGARWFAEVHYVAPDDAESGNAANNATYREMTFTPASEGFTPTFISGAANALEPAIKAWPQIDSGAMVVDVDVADDGRFHIGSSVVDNFDGTWRYEYAVHNLNSDRSARAFSVPVPPGATLTNVGFHDADYHSGEIYDGTDWAFERAGGTATWSTDEFDTNPDANAIRWGTAYSFWFTADVPPTDADASLTLFKPGVARGGVAAAVRAPSGACAADLDASGAVDSGDLAELLAAWGGMGTADLDASGDVGASDLAILLAAWGDCD